MFYVNVDYIPQSKDVECSIKTGDDNKIFVAWYVHSATKAFLVRCFGKNKNKNHIYSE